jgi:hypothetical protein
MTAGGARQHLDSTALDHDTCVDLIVADAQIRARNPRPTPPT